MFLATHMPLPLPSPATSLSVESSSSTSPATTAALAHIDHIFRRALGRATFSSENPLPFPHDAATWRGWLYSFTTDDLIAAITMLVFFLVLYLVLLATKLLLGMCLLSFARNRYRGMKAREQESAHAEGRRLGGWGVTEVDEEKKRWFLEDDREGLRGGREREREREKGEKGNNAGTGKGKGDGGGLTSVSRYSMVAKRIW